MPKFRTAILGDETRLADLAARTFRQTYERNTTPENLESHLRESFFPDQQRSEIRDPNILTLVLDAGVELIGYAQIRSGECPTSHGSDSDSELWRIYVDKPYHGKGFGSLLLGEALAAAVSEWPA